MLLGVDKEARLRAVADLADTQDVLLVRLAPPVAGNHARVVACGAQRKSLSGTGAAVGCGRGRRVGIPAVLVGPDERRGVGTRVDGGDHLVGGAAQRARRVRREVDRDGMAGDAHRERRAWRARVEPLGGDRVPVLGRVVLDVLVPGARTTTTTRPRTGTVTYQQLNPGAPSSPLSVSVRDTPSRSNLATDGTGGLSSTTDQVIAAINAIRRLGARLGREVPREREQATAIPQPTAAPVPLSDFLWAPQANDASVDPGYRVPRKPYQQYVLRICKVCDGSKTGFFVYAQEHAREWVGPLVALETANRC